MKEPDVVHVTVPPGSRSGDDPGVRRHWSRLAPHEIEAGATSPLRTVLDCATHLPFAEALAVADGAVSESFVRREQLIRAAGSSPARGRAARMRVARHADRRAENPFESVLRAHLVEHRITGFVPQQPVRTGRRLRHVDLGDGRRRIAMEADSYAHHGSRLDLVRDCERYDGLVAAGWTVLRFTYEHVMFRAGWVVEMVRAACSLR